MICIRDDVYSRATRVPDRRASAEAPNSLILYGPGFEPIQIRGFDTRFEAATRDHADLNTIAPDEGERRRCPMTLIRVLRGYCASDEISAGGASAGSMMAATPSTTFAVSVSARFANRMIVRSAPRYRAM